MDQKLGTEALTKVLLVAIEVGNVADKIGRDTSSSRWMHLGSLYDEVLALPTLNVKNALAEAKDLDVEERANLYIKVKGALTLEDKVLEEVIEEGLAIIVDAASLVERSVNLSKKLKGA